MLTKLISLLLLCLVASNIYAQDRENAIRSTFHSISSNDMMNDATELTSSKYGGRLSGSPGYLAAAQWIAGELKKAGVKPGLKDSIYINLDMVGNGTGLYLAGGNSYPEILKYFSNAKDKYIHRDFSSSENHPSYSRPRTDGAIFERAGYKTLALYTLGTVKPVYYHHPLDTTDALTPEIMEDAAKLLYLGVLGLSYDNAFATK